MDALEHLKLTAMLMSDDQSENSEGLDERPIKRGPHRFKKGEPRPKGSGRKKGTPNRMTVALKDAVIAAAETRGYMRKNKKGKYTATGKGGLQAYMNMLATEHVELFATAFLAKMIPMH